MKKNIFNTIALAAMLLLTGCMNFEPEAELSDAQVWTTADNFELFANQFYSWTRDFSTTTTYQCGVADGPHSDTRSDLMCESSLNVYSAGTNAIPESDSNYGSLYTHIYYCNLLLDRAESFANQNDIRIPVAEAKFFRAYSYFELVQLYGNAILVTKPLDMSSPELQASRNDRSEIIDLCVKDLQEAAAALPVTATEAGRLTQDAAWAFLSRVALYEGTWQKFHTGGAETTTNSERVTTLLNIAKDASKRVIEGGRCQLFYSNALGTDSYRYMFILEDTRCNPAGLTTTDNKEYILARRHRLDDGIGFNITKAYLTNAIYPTRKLANLYLCQDGLPITKSTKFQGYSGVVSEYQNRDNRMLTTLAPNGELVWDNTARNCRTAWDASDNDRAKTVSVMSNSGYQTHKWAVERQVADRMEAMSFPVIRYAEVLLNFAESIYELNGRISDGDLDKSLNLVRRRVNPSMPKLTNAFAENNGLSIREEIRRERTVELAFEGFRIDDLKRWATAKTEMPQDLLGVLYRGTWFEANWTTQARPLNSEGCIVMYSGRTWADKNYLYPLPSDQLQLNPNLGQNPGWE